MAVPGVGLLSRAGRTELAGHTHKGCYGVKKHYVFHSHCPSLTSPVDSAVLRGPIAEGIQEILALFPRKAHQKRA